MIKRVAGNLFSCSLIQKYVNKLSGNYSICKFIGELLDLIVWGEKGRAHCTGVTQHHQCHNGICWYCSILSHIAYLYRGDWFSSPFKHEFLMGHTNNMVKLPRQQ